MDIKSYINELFEYLDLFESRYDQFETEAFLQTYNGIYAVFQALRRQRNEAVDVDLYFLNKIKTTPLTSSDLRQLTLQVLITYFESESDIDGQSNKSYLYCRDLRPVKRDISFFEDHLVPLLFHEGGLNNNFRLNEFFLREIARYLDKFGHPFKDAVSPEQFGALSDPRKFLTLMGRRVALGEDVARDRGSLEFHLQRIDAFTKLGRKSRLYEHYLMSWDYLRKTSFWATVRSSFAGLWGKFKGAFKNARYFRLVTTQRSGAYLFYGLIIVFFVFLAIYVPMRWKAHNQIKLHEFEMKARNPVTATTK